MFSRLKDKIFAPISGARMTFHGIDLLRGIAAISILVFHFKNFSAGGGDLNRTSEWLDRVNLLTILSPIRNYGSLSVMLFWTISGFVFMNVYAGKRPSGKTFLVNRIARLYPLHLLTLLIIACVQAAAMQNFGQWLIYPSNDLPHFVSHLFFASAWGDTSVHSFNGPVWSVSVEVLIYAVFYLYVRFAKVSIFTNVLGLFAFFALSLAFRGSQIMSCGCFFFGGMLAYSFFDIWPKEQRGILIGLSGVTLLLLSAIGIALNGARLPLTLWLLPIFGAAILIAAASEENRLGAFARRAHVVGDITYSTYLWHSPLQMLFLFGAMLGYWSVDAAFTDIFFIGYLVVVCVVAWLSFRFIERPAQRWIQYRFNNRVSYRPAIAAP